MEQKKRDSKKNAFKISILTITIGVCIISILKYFFPLTPKTEFLTFTVIVSILISMGINFCWKHWTKKRR